MSKQHILFSSVERYGNQHDQRYDVQTKQGNNPMQQLTDQHLSTAAAQAFLEAVPEKIKAALIAYAAEIEYPIEAVIEMAVSGFLDEDALSFVDCQPIAFGRLRQ
ncbi:hypothetical protein [Phormidesmis priestleyi]